MSELEEWLNSLPKPQQSIVRNLGELPNCFTVDGRGHYEFYSSYEDENGAVRLKMDHLPDSFLPNHRVYGIDPASVKACGCWNRR